MSEIQATPPTVDTTSQKLVDSPIPSATEPPVNGTAPFVDKSNITPPPSAKTAKKSFSYTSPTINFEDDPNTYLKTKVESLIYWEYPKKSASFLLGSLSILILTQYYSLLQIVAGFFTLITGLNWAFVNTHKQGQKYIGGKSGDSITNPHSQRLEYKGTYIPRDRVLRTAQLTIDVIEVIAQQITKLVLIEDNWRSAISLVVSYLVWTLGKYISTKYLVGFFVVSAFTLPRLYLQHQDVVDAHVATQTKNARILAEKYGSVATAKARELSTQATTFIKSKSSSVSSTTAKKAE